MLDNIALYNEILDPNSNEGDIILKLFPYGQGIIKSFFGLDSDDKESEMQLAILIAVREIKSGAIEHHSSPNPLAYIALKIRSALLNKVSRKQLPKVNTRYDIGFKDDRVERRENIRIIREVIEDCHFSELETKIIELGIDVGFKGKKLSDTAISKIIFDLGLTPVQFNQVRVFRLRSKIWQTLRSKIEKRLLLQH